MAITNKDIDKLKGVFATKEDLDNKFKEVLSGQDRIIGELVPQSGIPQHTLYKLIRRREKSSGGPYIGYRER